MDQEARKKILADIDRMARESVASARVQPSSSKDVLTEHQRARVKQISDSLSKDENPYTELANRGQLGVGSDPKDRPEPKVREMSKEQVSSLEAKWANKFEPVEPPIYIDVDLGSEQDPTKLYCSFCGIEVNQLDATIGRGPLRKSVKDIYRELPSGEKTFEVEMKHFSSKVVACPAHSLQVQPTVSKVVTKTIKVKETLNLADCNNITLPTAQTQGKMVTREREYTVTTGGEQTSKGTDFSMWETD